MTARHNGREPIDPVAYQDRCPGCGERECDALVWLDDERVACQTCRTVYRPRSMGDTRDQPGKPANGGRDGS